MSDKRDDGVGAIGLEDIVRQANVAFAPLIQARAMIESAIAPIQAIHSYVASLVTPLQDIAKSIFTPQMLALFENIGRQMAVKEALSRAGWLPHPTIPHELVFHAVDDGPLSLSATVERHLEDNWCQVAAYFRSRFERSRIDDEGLATMGEALKAREVGLHRATCRLVFPEIERVVRLRLPPPDPLRMASLQELRQALGELPIGDPDTPPLLWLAVFEHVHDVCYAHVDAEATAGDFPIPNRHAITHGRVSYSTPRDSMNSLVIADFIFTAIEAIIAQQTAAAEGTAEPSATRGPL